MQHPLLLAGIVVLSCLFSTASFSIGASRGSDGGPEHDATAELPLIFQDDFDRDEPTGWDFTDRSAWRITQVDDQHKHALDLFTKGKYEPPYRSPLNIALAPGLDLADFELDVRVRSTGRDYGQRDVCFFFGHQDSSHFYYAHLATKADDVHNTIHIVNGKPRTAIAETRSKGTPWTDGWHNVRIARKVKEGLIQVFFDDMKNPAMTAHDTTFSHGRIGVGSFDDTAMFDEVRIRGNRN